MSPRSCLGARQRVGYMDTNSVGRNSVEVGLARSRYNSGKGNQGLAKIRGLKRKRLGPAKTYKMGLS